MTNGICGNEFQPSRWDSFLCADDPALKRRAIANRRAAAQGKTWAEVTVVPSEQVGISPTFLME
jgi:hypothetical protein